MIILISKMFSEIIYIVRLLLNLQMCQIILPDPVTLFWYGPLFLGAVKISYSCITVVPYVNLTTASSFDLGLLL